MRNPTSHSMHFNNPEHYGLNLPAANGHATARGLARIYAAVRRPRAWCGGTPVNSPARALAARSWRTVARSTT